MNIIAGSIDALFFVVVGLGVYYTTAELTIGMGNAVKNRIA